MPCKILISYLYLWILPSGNSTDICKSKCKQGREDNILKRDWKEERNTKLYCLRSDPIMAYSDLKVICGEEMPAFVHHCFFLLVSTPSIYILLSLNSS